MQDETITTARESSTSRKYRVTYTFKNSLLKRVKLFLASLSIRRPFVKKFANHLLLNLQYVIQGMIGLLTLGIFSRPLTRSTMMRIAVLSKQCDQIRKEDREKLASNIAGTTPPSKKSTNDATGDGSLSLNAMYDMIKQYEEQVSKK